MTFTLVDIVGRTNNFSNCVAKEGNFKIVISNIVGNRRKLKMIILKLFFYIINLFKFIITLLSGDKIIYNIPLFVLFESLVIRIFKRSQVGLILHNQNIHHNRKIDWSTFFFFNSFDWIVCHDKNVYNFIKNKIVSNNIYYTPLPLINILNKKENILKKNKKNKKFRVAYLGQLRKQKGIDLVFDWVIKHKKVNDGVIVCVFGEPIDILVPDKFRTRPDTFVLDYFIPENEFISQILKCDLVILPYKSSSGSAVLSLIVSLKIPIVSNNLNVFDDLAKNHNFIKTIKITEPQDIGKAIQIGISLSKKTNLNWDSAISELSLSNYVNILKNMFK